MSIAEVIELPRGSREKYDQVINEVGLSGSKLAPGQLVHFAGPLEGGGWQIFNVWESQAAHEAWVREVIAPAMQAAGAAPFRQEAIPLHHAFSR